ncbi:MAG TPA: peptidase S10, partial [Thermoanaerobaculia bacterium]|nr:peptidase S10 [Thermoanaerobaculia bacterium]
MTMKRFGLPLALLLALLPLPASGQGTPGPSFASPTPPHREEPREEKKEEKKPAPEEKASQTHHVLTLGGQKIPYTATAGTLLLKNDEGAPVASFFYVAYVKDGLGNPGDRPVTFSFNGGPGSASLWVNLGAFGPVGVAHDPEGKPLPPPARLVDNDLSLLDTT